jgi:hypothetical protein
MQMTVLGCLLLMSAISPAQTARERSVQKAVIERAQKALVSTFDSTLPKVSLKFFLESESEGAKINWEVNDCGEQTGNPAIDRGRDIPTCVEASFTLKDHRSVNVMIAVGTVSKGVTGVPSLFSSTITDENGTRSIKLIELPAQIHRGRQKSSPADRAPIVGNVLA